MYDSERREFFLGLPHEHAASPHWWERAEPVWLAAERRRLRSAVYWWPGCEVALNETRPAICMPHRSPHGWHALDADFRRKLDEVLEVFDTDELSLAMLYYGAVAYAGQFRGPESKERHKALFEFDNHLNYLLDKLEALNLTEKVTLMVVSDHGIANTSPDSTTPIHLEKYSPYIKYMLNFGSHAMVLPRKDMFLPVRTRRFSYENFETAVNRCPAPSELLNFRLSMNDLYFCYIIDILDGNKTRQRVPPLVLGGKQPSLQWHFHGNGP
ncbi:unnamed protein product [Ixodes hexagonus]